MKECPFCGPKIRNENAHCPGCGYGQGISGQRSPFGENPWRRNQNASPSPFLPNGNNNQAPAQKRFNIALEIILIILAVLVPLVGIIVGIVFLCQNDRELKRVGKVISLVGGCVFLLGIVMAAVIMKSSLLGATILTY